MELNIYTSFVENNTAGNIGVGIIIKIENQVCYSIAKFPSALAQVATAVHAELYAIRMILNTCVRCVEVKEMNVLVHYNEEEFMRDFIHGDSSGQKEKHKDFSKNIKKSILELKKKDCNVAFLKSSGLDIDLVDLTEEVKKSVNVYTNDLDKKILELRSSENNNFSFNCASDQLREHLGSLELELASTCEEIKRLSRELSAIKTLEQSLILNNAEIKSENKLISERIVISKAALKVNKIIKKSNQAKILLSEDFIADLLLDIEAIEDALADLEKHSAISIDFLMQELEKLTVEKYALKLTINT